MSIPCPLPADVLEFVRRVVYGPGYRRAREGAMRRSRGICQICGKRSAAEAHHWGLHYPADDEVSADALIAVCRPCHRMATLRRLLDRSADQPLWLILATPTFPVSPTPGGTMSRGGRARAPRHRPRSCGAPEQPSVPRSAPGSPAMALRTLVERCHLTLFAGCLGCGRFVRLDSIPHFRGRGWSGSVGDLRRRLCCCRCRSRTQWVLLGGWPSSETGASTGQPRRPAARRETRP